MHTPLQCVCCSLRLFQLMPGQIRSNPPFPETKDHMNMPILNVFKQMSPLTQDRSSLQRLLIRGSTISYCGATLWGLMVCTEEERKQSLSSRNLQEHNENIYSFDKNLFFCFSWSFRLELWPTYDSMLGLKKDFSPYIVPFNFVVLQVYCFSWFLNIQNWYIVVSYSQLLRCTTCT